MVSRTADALSGRGRESLRGGGRRPARRGGGGDPSGRARKLQSERDWRQFAAGADAAPGGDDAEGGCDVLQRLRQDGERRFAARAVAGRVSGGKYDSSVIYSGQRHERAAAQSGHDRQQSGELVDGGVPPAAVAVSGHDLPEPRDAGGGAEPGDGFGGTADRSGHEVGGERGDHDPGRHEPDEQSAGSGDSGNGVLSGVPAGRNARVYPRRELLPEQSGNSGRCAG